MPILDWIGKKQVINHDKEVPFRLLKRVQSLSVVESENLIIKGDNLEALKALLPYYYNKVKCIYIDPPYNKGNENWIYNDKVNSPEIKKWLGKVVGSEGEDLSRHDKWLCMMYPRLKLLRELLADKGVIFISIDENEEHYLRAIMDEIFGYDNFIEKIIWNKRIPKNDKGIGNIHEYIILYTKNSEYKHKFMMPKGGIDEVYEFVAKLKFRKTPIDKSELELKKFYERKGYDRGITLYCNLDNEYRIWGKINVSWPNAKNGPRYNVLHPKTKKPTKVPDNGWRWKEETFQELVDYNNYIERYDGSFVCGRIWFAKDENTQPSYIQYLDNVKDFLFRSIQSIKSSGGMELDEILPNNNFPHPKTHNLLKRLLSSVEGDVKGDDFIILDSFAGSGTTAHAVLELNKEDGGNRKFILVEMEDEIARKVAAERVKRVVKGYTYKNSKGDDIKVEGLGGGFQFMNLDTELFDAHGLINDNIDYIDLARYIFFSETKLDLKESAMKNFLIGERNGTEYYLIYKEGKENILNEKAASKLKKTDKEKIVYADNCMLDSDTLAELRIVFKQIPYEVRGF